MQTSKDYIERAIRFAEEENPPGIPRVAGYSSDKIRRLLHWLCRPLDTNYLEIGVHLGSTLIPALWGNDHAVATCLDDWSLGEGTRADLEANLRRWLPSRVSHDAALIERGEEFHRLKVIAGDMFTVDLALIPPGVNVYFFDGPHTREGQYQAFVRFDPVLAPHFVACVDDYNWIEPREETQRAFRDLHYTVEAEWWLPAYRERDSDNWWNGFYIALVHKDEGAAVSAISMSSSRYPALDLPAGPPFRGANHDTMIEEVITMPKKKAAPAVYPEPYPVPASAKKKGKGKKAGKKACAK